MSAPSAWICAAAAALGACASPREPVAMAGAPMQVTLPAPVIVQVNQVAETPRAGVCVPRTLRPAPRYPDSDAALRAAPGAADRYQLLAAGRLMRQKRLEELERVIAACRS